MRVLIVYATSEGQTRKVATYLADRFLARSHSVTVVDADKPPTELDPGGYDAIVVAARVHSGRYPSSVRRFVRRNLATLTAKPSAFVSVSLMAAVGTAKAAGALARYVGRFSRKTGWTPRHVHHAAGARFYTRHGAVGRWILRKIDSKAFGQSMDVGRDHEWTDWDALGRFADAFLAAARTTEVAAPS
jgi:menaquinone-dependent protoporphyrinogen oxidase